MAQPNLESELNDAQRDEVDSWVLSGVNYTEIIARLQQREWPSRSLGSWTGYKRRAEQRAVQKSIFNGNTFRSQIEELKKGTTDQTLQAQLHLLGQVALQLTVNGTADPGQLKMAHKLVALTLEAEGMKQRAALEQQKLADKQKALELDERRVALLEKKASQAEQTDQVLSDAALTPEQREQRIKEIYGRA